MERTLLFDAFQSRGTMDYEDRVVPRTLGRNREKDTGSSTEYSTPDLPGEGSVISILPSD